MADYDWTGGTTITGDSGGSTSSGSSGSSWSDIWNTITSNDLVSSGGKVLDFIGGALGGEQGKGAQVGGIAALSYLLNQLGGSNQPKYSGYTGGIPSYTATREQNPIPTTVTTSSGQTVPRRPGSGGIEYFKPITYTPKAAEGGLMEGYPSEPVIKMAHGGIASLGGYSDGGRLLKGPGDGVSDSIPAVIGERQPARLADGEFVIPARIVSELGNGSTEAGARKLYAMMDRIQKQRKKTVGKGKVAVNSKADKHLPA